MVSFQIPTVHRNVQKGVLHQGSNVLLDPNLFKLFVLDEIFGIVFWNWGIEFVILVKLSQQLYLLISQIERSFEFFQLSTKSDVFDLKSLTGALSIDVQAFLQSLQTNKDLSFKYCS